MTQPSNENPGITALLPGLVLAVAVMVLSMLLTKAAGHLLPWEKNPVSPMLVAIILGMIIRTTVPLPWFLDP